MKLYKPLLLSLVALSSVALSPLRAAEVTTFTGGDPGEGLDLEGYFTYAVNVGPNGAAGQIGDALFTADNAVGVTVQAANAIGNGGWGAANYGDTQNDRNLSFAMNSIRWAPSPDVVNVSLKVQQGAEYKLQILQHEHCCLGRGFAVIINGVTEVENYRTDLVQMGGPDGDFQGTRDIVGGVITKQFVAASDTVTFQLSGPAATEEGITDRNAILNAFTLERITPLNDTDSDGLQDEWEVKTFGNLAQTGSGDFDNDLLTNAMEFAEGTNAIRPDSDGDGLLDGAEVNIHKSSPLRTDTDGDNLPDGYEIRTSKTDAAKVDTDEDGSTDYQELVLGSNPSDSANKPLSASISVVTGGDPGEGLDLAGNFVYALSPGGDTAVQVGDAFFQPLFADEVPGVSLLATYNILNWYNVNYGESEADLNLKIATSSIRWSAAGETAQPDVILTLSDLQPGAEYKLQLMFGEACCNRGFDIFVDEQLVANDFNPGVIQGGIGNGAREAAFTFSFFAKGPSAVIRLDGRSAGSSIADRNAIINGATLEKLLDPADSDSDGLPDAWETSFGGNLSHTSTADPDSDGVTTGDEFLAGTDPSRADTDGDGLSDGAERAAGTNSRFQDTDSDGWTDGYETNTSKTNPLLGDTDGDTLGDSDEANIHGTNPTKSDTDGDGVPDGIELVLGTNPTVPDREGLTVLGVVRGGDAGEGLDLDGTFMYAFSAGAPEGTVAQVRDATFVSLNNDENPGAILLAQNTAAGWYGVNYGDSENDQNLETATSSIRWSAAANASRPDIILRLDGFEVGAQYKIQIIFGEACCNRGFDVFLDGGMIINDFNPGVVQGGLGVNRQSAVITQNHFAKSTTMTVRLDGRNTPFPDKNAIINAITVEKVNNPINTDNDGLPDEWEKFFFTNLSQGANGDPDGDGVPNSWEYALNRDPLVAEANRDSDGDGLQDLAEIQTHGTNPGNPDTDGDTLNDNQELTVLLTDPKKTDTDSDGLADNVEVMFFTNPLVNEPATVTSNVSIAMVMGGDPGEGLDLQGNFAYAVNVGSNPLTQPAVAGDATFTSDTAPGVRVVARSQVMAWLVGLPMGDSPADDVIEEVYSSIRYDSNPRPRVELDVVPGGKYKLQLLFAEACCPNRGYDIYIDGVRVAEKYVPADIQGGIGSGAGGVFTTDVATQRSKLVIALDGPGALDGIITDSNAILNGFTLEILSAGAAPAEFTFVSRSPQGTVITFTSVAGAKYTLEYKENLSDATWTSAATDITATSSSTTYTDSDATRRGKATGFYRIKTQ